MNSLRNKVHRLITCPIEFNVSTKSIECQNVNIYTAKKQRHIKEIIVNFKIKIWLLFSACYSFMRNYIDDTRTQIHGNES